MKQYLALALLCCLPYAGSLLAQANAIDTYFSQYVEDERFSVVYISPKLFQMIDRIGAEQLDLEGSQAEAFRDVARDLRGLRILSTDVNARQFYNEARQRIDTRTYEPLMTVRNRSSENVEFMVRETTEGIIEELLLISIGDSEFTLLSFVGRIDLDKVARLAREMDEND